MVVKKEADKVCRSAKKKGLALVAGLGAIFQPIIVCHRFGRKWRMNLILPGSIIMVSRERKIISRPGLRLPVILEILLGRLRKYIVIWRWGRGGLELGEDLDLHRP